jgi:hypothetical protein
MRHESSSEAQLSDDDMRIVKAIEAGGRFTLYGWEVPDFCRINFIFDDILAPKTRMGMTVDTYPIEKEGDDE